MKHLPSLTPADIAADVSMSAAIAALPSAFAARPEHTARTSRARRTRLRAAICC